jgi:hypothetical protein
MSISDNVALCAFVSYAHYLAGRECGAPVTHAYNGELLCRDHFIYESKAYPVCNSCHASKYEDVRVFLMEHTCAVGDMGGDCMHFEDAQYCTCESDHAVAICIHCEEYARIYDHELCEGCAEELSEEDRFYHETYLSQ